MLAPLFLKAPQYIGKRHGVPAALKCKFAILRERDQTLIG